MDAIQLSALAVTAALCALTLRGRVPALATVLALAAGTLLLSRTMDGMARLKGFSDSLASLAGLPPAVWKPVRKTVGVALVTKLSAAVCRDGGEGSLAAFLEAAGTVLALLAALPLLEALLGELENFL